MAEPADWTDLVRQFRDKAGQMGMEVPLGFFTPTGMIAPPAPAVQQGNLPAGAEAAGDPPHLHVFNNSAPATPRRGGPNHYERVASDIPIEKFPYGKPGADWQEWCRRFEIAVQAATNAADRDRLNDLCLMWISLKLPEEAQPIFGQCQNRNSWPHLKAELELALEDVQVKRKWARSLAAFKKPSDMSLQIYRAKVIGMVAKHSPILVADPVAYQVELFNKFIHGLEVDWREYIEDSLPYGKETIENAYNQALKYEAKLAEKKVDFSAAAMTDSEKNSMECMRLDLQEVKTELQKVKKSRTSEGQGSSSFQSRDSSRSFQNRDSSRSGDSQSRGRKEFKNDPRKKRYSPAGDGKDHRAGDR